MPRYDREAAYYDATRGGDARADAAAASICAALGDFGQAGVANVVDVACGTGIVTVRMARRGYRVIGVDRSPSMLSVAAARLPGRLVRSDATSLPLAAGSADAVTMVWLLQLLTMDESARALAEAARILRPGGVLATTVDKNDSAYHDKDDAAARVGQVRAGAVGPQSDAAGRVIDLAGSLRLSPLADTSFAGLGQGLSPRGWRRRLERATGHLAWARQASRESMAALHRDLASLPDQDRARPDPEYRVLVLGKTISG